MAQRYSGKYSPGPGGMPQTQPPRFRNRRARNVNIAARAMYFAPLPLLFAGLGEIMSGDALGMTIEVGSFAILMLGAVLLNEGLKAEAAYESRTIARPPAIPRKLFAAACTALGVGIASYLSAGTGLLGAPVFAAVAAGAQLYAFGLDPMRKKGLDGVSDFETDRVARAIDDAEATVGQILAAAKRIGDRRIEGRVEDMLTSVRDVFRAVEDDPRDLTRARKFIGVYLRGARDATVKFADLYSRRQDQEARTQYEALLSDLEASFRNHRDQLLLDDRSDLDTEIEGLRERLQREGV